MSLFNKLNPGLKQPVDIAFLAYVRIIFGFIMLVEMSRFYHHGWISKYWVKPAFFFRYPGFEWMPVLPESGIFALFGVLTLCALFIMLGLFYRISMPVFFIGFSYLFFSDKTNYLNHFYLITLLSGIMCFLPAHKYLSLDAKFFPKIKEDWVPGWMLWLLRFQLAVAYFYGGLAKINPDWLRGEPMRTWLANKTDFPIIGSLFTEEWMVYLFSYGGLFLDLLIVPFLIWKRTRWFAFGAGGFFHLMNAKLFAIGNFPWFMIFATAIFFEPEKFRWFDKISRNAIPAQYRLPKVGMAVVMVYVMFQLLFPFRSQFNTGNVLWNEQGLRFSWRMMLRSKSTDIKVVVINNETKIPQELDLANHLTKKQVKVMAKQPDMMAQFCEHIAGLIEAKGLMSDFDVRVQSLVGLNGREKQYMVDPERDMKNVSYKLTHNDWILPLNPPRYELGNQPAGETPIVKVGESVEKPTGGPNLKINKSSPSQNKVIKTKPKVIGYDQKKP